MNVKEIKKGSLVKVSVEDLDADIITESLEKPVFMREKTFNSELGFLLNTISNNEKTAASRSSGVNTVNTDYSLKNAALYEIEKMIYELKHFNHSGEGVSGLNPFNLDINVYDEIDDLNDYIAAGMKQAGFDKFVLLRFNLSDNAFRTDLNFINDNMTTDLFFGLEDKIIKKINVNKSGVIITPESIKNDDFLYKKFRSSFNNTDEILPFYIVRVGNICLDSSRGTFYEEKLPGYDDFLSPLLLIELDKTHQIDSDNIFSVLLEYSSIPLAIYMMNFAVKAGISDFDYKDTLLIIDLFAKTLEKSKMKIAIIRLDDYSVKENVFIFTFLLSKMRKKLQRSSLFIRININQAVLVCSDDEYSILNAMVTKINENTEIVSIELFEYKSKNNESNFTRLFL